jgi:hypothetical protein
MIAFDAALHFSSRNLPSQNKSKAIEPFPRLGGEKKQR